MSKLIRYLFQAAATVGVIFLLGIVTATISKVFLLGWNLVK